MEAKWFFTIVALVFVGLLSVEWLLFHHLVVWVVMWP